MGKYQLSVYHKLPAGAKPGAWIFCESAIYSHVFQISGWEQLVNPAAKDKQMLALLDALVDWQKEDKLFENQQLFKTPIVRNGKKATVGYQPDVWKDWE